MQEINGVMDVEFVWVARLSPSSRMSPTGRTSPFTPVSSMDSITTMITRAVSHSAHKKIWLVLRIRVHGPWPHPRTRFWQTFLHPSFSRRFMSHKLKQIKWSGRKIGASQGKKKTLYCYFCVELDGVVVVLYVFEDQSIGRCRERSRSSSSSSSMSAVDSVVSWLLCLISVYMFCPFSDSSDIVDVLTKVVGLDGCLWRVVRAIVFHGVSSPVILSCDESGDVIRKVVVFASYFVSGRRSVSRLSIFGMGDLFDWSRSLDSVRCVMSLV